MEEPIRGDDGGDDGVVASPPPTFVCGVSFPEQLHDASTSLRRARTDGFDYVVTALPDVVSSSVPTQTIRTDVTRLEARWWSTSVVGTVVDPPRWATIGGEVRRHDGAGLVDALTCTRDDSSSARRRREAGIVLRGMMEWAAHMNVPAVILPPVPLTERIGSTVDDDDDGGRNPTTKTTTTTTTTIGGDDDDAMDQIIDSDDENDMFAGGGGAPPPVPSANNPSAREYARIVANLSSSSACSSSNVRLWLRVSLTVVDVNAYLLLLARCDHDPSVGCVIHVDKKFHDVDMPDIVRILHILLGGGHVRAMCWDVSAFLRNRGGYPTLSRQHRAIFALVYGRLGRTLRTLVEGDVSSSLGGGGDDRARPIHHLQYLRHLRSRPNLPSKLDSEESILETPYLDNLQSPLQPLGDHLEYQTYETFEKDPVKYERYGAAIAMALEDGMRGGRYPFLGSTRTAAATSMNLAASEDDDDVPAGEDVVVDVHRVTILVVGAGRGPLVSEAVRAVARVSASLATDRGKDGRRRRPRRALHASIVAIEKNPSAVLYLRGMKCVDPSWNGGLDYDPRVDGGGDAAEGEGSIVIPGTSVVAVIGCDMREAASDPLLGRMTRDETRRADIVVSELLGSFGDNELSPECLDGVQRCGILKDNCVSIPQSYTAFVAPVSSARLHYEAKTQSCLPLNANEGPASPHVGAQRAMETPYVVRTHAASQTHKEQACWTFSHPHPSRERASASDNVGINDAACDSSSAKAADSINNDRHAYISFPHDPIGAASGCGYGQLDADVSSILLSDPTGISACSDTTIVIHGFLGSFHSVLYESPPSISKTIEKAMNNKENGENRSSVISIAPHSFSVGMFSWFPLYFPLKHPLSIPPGATVNCNIWRRSDESRVWYEWCAEVMDNRDGGTREPCVLVASSIHNPGGRSYYVKK